VSEFFKEALLYYKADDSKAKWGEKRSLQGVNEHFELLFNTANAALGINQSFLSSKDARVKIFVLNYYSQEGR